MADIVDIGDDNTKSSQHTVNITGQDFGYLVSHKNYGQGSYLANRNWTLNLVGFNQSALEIDFEKVEIKDKSEGICNDYLLVSTLKQICTMPSQTSYINLTLTQQQVSFTFFTNRRTEFKGFWISYRGTATCECFLVLAKLTSHRI